MTVRRKGLLGAALLFVVLSVAFAPFLWGDRSMMSSSAETASIFATGASPQPVTTITALKLMDPGAAGWQTEPEFILEHKLASQGSSPIWNPYAGFGEPLAADMLSQPYYPLTWTLALHPTPRAYNWYVVLRLWLAGLFTFLFLRYFVRFSAAFGGAIGFAFTGYFILYYNIAHISVEVLVPALLWGVERIVRRRDANAVGGFALVSAAAIFGGMPESALLAFAWAVLYGVVRIVADPVLAGARAALAGRCAAGLALGVLVSAVLVLPFLEFWRHSLSQHVVNGGGIPGLGADPWDVRALAVYLAPLVNGPPWNNIFSGFSGWSGIRGYWGVATTFLALVAVASRIAERYTGRLSAWTPEAFFGLSAIVLLLKRFGAPVVNWIGAIPGFALLNFPKYDEAILGMCVAALAAFGIERLASRRTSRAPVSVSVLAILVVLTVAAASARPQFLQLTVHGEFLLWALGWSLSVLAVAWALAWYSGRIDARYVSGGAAALIALDVLACYFVPMWFVVNQPPPLARDAADGAPYVAYVQQMTSRTHERFVGLDGLLYPEWPSAFGIADVRDLNALYASDYLPFVRAFFANDAPTQAELQDRFTGGTLTRFDDASSRRFLSLASVRFIGARHDLGDAAHRMPASLTSAFKTADAQVFRFDDPLPRISIYSRVEQAANTADALRVLTSRDYDIHTAAVVTLGETAAATAVADLRSGAAKPVAAGSLDVYRSDFVRATVEAPSRALVVLNDTDYPGWAAALDGKAAPIVRANGLFRGVEVPAGRHVLEFRYRPGSFTIGLALTIAGLAICAALLLTRTLRRMLRPASEVLAHEA